MAKPEPASGGEYVPPPPPLGRGEGGGGGGRGKAGPRCGRRGVRAGARGRAGVREAWDGALPHVPAQPPAASPAPVMATGQLPPPPQTPGSDRVAEPVASDGGEGRAGGAWVGRTPPALPLPA